MEPNNDPAQKFQKISSDFQGLLSDLENKTVPSNVPTKVNAYVQNLQHLNSTINNKERFTQNEYESAVSTLLSLIMGVTTSLSSFNEADESIKQRATQISQDAKELAKSIANKPVTFKSDKNNKKESTTTTNTPLSDFATQNISSEYKSLEDQHKKALKNIEERILKAENETTELHGRIEKELEKINKLYDNSIKDLNSKKNESSTLLEAISRDTFSGNYEERAFREEEIADKLRNWSLISMAVAIAIIIATVIEASFNSYSLPNAILRFGLIFAVTIPSAYLARESNKHREKHNSYLEKSLDLKALSPFIASLEKNIQDDIKTRIADRLFAKSANGNLEHFELPTTSVDAALEIIEKAKKLNDKKK